LKNSRPAEIRNRCKRIHNLLLLRPSDVIRKRLRSALDITRRQSENDICKPLHQISDRNNKPKITTDLRRSIAIENKGMEKLRKRNGHQQPAAEPFRAFSQPPLGIQNIKRELQAPHSCINHRGQSKLILRSDSQSKARQTCADGWRIAGCQGLRNARVALSEGLRIFSAEVCP